ncbi:MAG: ATP-dependent DNA helicase RecG [bacterium]|nr:ATP-dependent DNA helicase RecG [bacterium]
MLNMDLPIEKLYSVGPKYQKRLHSLGIKTVKDLLYHFPHRYDDYSKLMPIEGISEAGTIVTIVGEVADISVVRTWKRRMTIVNASIQDESGLMRVVWFNQPYIADTLKAGTAVSLSGKVSLDKKGLYLSSPSYERLSLSDYGLLQDNSKNKPSPMVDSQLSGRTHTGRLVPVYPETEGISSKYIRFLLKPFIKQLGGLRDGLPEEIRKKYDLPDVNGALASIHFPEKIEEAELARKRFAVEELLLFQLRALLDRRKIELTKAPQINFDEKLIAGLVKSLPFELTKDQKISAYEILKDLERPHPMNRLLNGDVGSGKTVVALVAAYQAVQNGYQAVFMAPTEILANQHFNTIKMLIGRLQLIAYSLQPRICLLTGSEAKQWPVDITEEEKISKKLLKDKIAKGEINIIIGTHAVIQKDMQFNNLGLVILDEQHRFGVQQRAALLRNPNLKTQIPNSKFLIPHLLSMTATPIPRTLALTIYGDLEVSLLKEKPKGRQEIITRVVAHTKRQDTYEFIRKQIKSGRQVFVVCPRIELSKAGPEKLRNGAGNRQLTIDNSQSAKPISQAKLVWADVKAVEDEYEKLSKKIFPELRVAMLHGRMKPKEKEQIMSKFKDREHDIIVSTSVIEVGVDVPNATIMMIESAERFGLAQLHQFRGRVGRGEHQSYCLLFTTDDGNAGRRLKALEKTNNGFELAEMDLKLRGPGEFTGVKQSGLPDLAMASLADVELIKQTRAEAKLLLKEDPALKKYPGLVERLKKMQRMVHFE